MNKKALLIIYCTTMGLSILYIYVIGDADLLKNTIGMLIAATGGFFLGIFLNEAFEEKFKVIQLFFQKLKRKRLILEDSVKLQKEEENKRNREEDINLFKGKTVSNILEDSEKNYLKSFTFNGKKALIVDRNNISRKFLKEILEQMLFNVKIEINENLVDSSFYAEADLVFIDYKLPFYEQAVLTEKHNINCKKPVIVILPAIFSNKKNEYMEDGADECICKPFRKSEIMFVLKKINKFLEGKQKR